MKRTLLDITQKISRSDKVAVLSPVDLNNAEYWIFIAKGWRFAEILREIEIRLLQDRITLMINTQVISNRDFIVESTSNGLLIKFIKTKFEYQLDEFDFIEIKGDIEQYA